MEIIRRTTDFIVLDADMFYNIMPHETDEDYYGQVEQIGSLSKNLMQAGKPVLWTMAGNLDKLPGTYNSQFFRAIYCLALVCDEESLKADMRSGRGILSKPIACWGIRRLRFMISVGKHRMKQQIM